jgi:hypothetical protein
MKSCLSLLAALLVMVLLAAAGYWAYQRNTGPANQNGHVLTAVSSDTSFTLTNATNYVLTVTMRQGPSLVRFQLAPGKSETRNFAPGTYSVEGSLSDPSTDPFASQWTFQNAGKYNATFTRDGQAVKVGGVLRLGAAEASSGNSQTSPANRRPPNLAPPERP